MQQFKLDYTAITKIAGLCGVLVPIVVFVCIGLSMTQAPWFRWTHNALSDLGIKSNAAAFFNIGMMLGGSLTFVFSLGLIRILSNKIGAYILSLSALGLIGIGLFPENIFTLHFISSATFFVLLALSLLLIGLKIKQNPFERNMGMLATLFAVVAIGSTIFLIPFEGVAIPEAFACFPAFIWCMIYGAKMTSDKSTRSFLNKSNL
ncbi:MAG: DUF998 domain-containing protein [Euryarchaeota archaeon]|nr:DUF998 domain-containing protein [Euryarchaeota archaeon]